MHKQEIDRLRSAVPELSPSVLVIGVDRLAQPQQLDGAEALSTCTGGFTVRTASGDLGVSTAAHCGNVQVAQGQTLNFRNEDQQGIRTCSGTRPVACSTSPTTSKAAPVCATFWGLATVPNKRRDRLFISFGMTTGRTCGEIQSKNYTPSFVTNAASTFVRVHGGKVMQSNGGDSGGLGTSRI